MVTFLKLFQVLFFRTSIERYIFSRTEKSSINQTQMGTNYTMINHTIRSIIPGIFTLSK